MVKIAIVVYSTYGHVLTLSRAEAEGAKAAGAEVHLFQLPSAESRDASAEADLEPITPTKLAEYDGVLFGIPSRFGSHPYAFKAFFDATGAQWASGAYFGKYAGFFTTSGTPGGGQESVARNSATILVHHGFLFVPLGYANAFGELTNLEEPHGGSPWGAGAFAGPSGARQASKLELDTARIQGKSFAETVLRAHGKGVKSGTSAGAAGAGAGAGAAGVGAAGVGAAGAGAAGAGTGTGAGATGATGAAGSKGVSAPGAATNAASTSGAPDATGAGATGAGTDASAAGATGATGAAGAGLSGADATGAGASGVPGASDIPGAKDVAGAKDGVSGAKDGVTKDASKDVSNLEGQAKSGPEALKGEATDAEKTATSAPQKGENAAENAADNAKSSAEKEEKGCCKCM